MAPLYFPIVIKINLRLYVENEMILSFAKFGTDFINIYKVTSCK